MNPAIIPSRQGVDWTMYRTTTGTTRESTAKIVARNRDTATTLEGLNKMTFGSSDLDVVGYREPS